MNLHSGTPFWLARNGIRPSRPTLTSHEQCDVVICGAGVTGALAADALTAAGLDVVIIERRESGLGSTSASTALLQYEIDVELLALGEIIGAERAARAYRASVRAVKQLADLAGTFEDCRFQPRHSLYLASTRKDARRLRDECVARAALGIECEWWSREMVKSRYGFPSYGGIRSQPAGEIDALALTRCLLDRATGRGARWYEQTTARGYEERDGGVRLFTGNGMTIDATHAICATGYDLPDFLAQNCVTLHSTFALATERVTHFGPWDDRCLVWESARPYTYMRTTDDRRIIIGGEDVPFRDAAWRDRLLPIKTRKLEAHLTAFLPSLPTETAFEWAGTFAETRDGLPCIGRDARYPGFFFALGYGGNGITFSAIAAELLSEACLRHDMPDADLYSLTRWR